MNLTTIAILGVVVLLVLMFLGMDIGMAMLGVGAVGYWMATNFGAMLGQLRNVPATQASDYALCVIPLFIMMGNFCFASGMSDGLFDVGDKWLSRLPGGLACAAIVACAGFGAICGSTAATAATMGVVAIPAMRKYGYHDSLSTGSISVGGTLGIMIPPSTPFIVYGIMSEVSIGRLFAAGVIPGILLAFLCCLTVVILVLRNKDLAPSTQRKITWKERLISLKGIVWVAILFIVVLGGMFSGFFTIYEAAAFGAFGGLVITAIRRRLTWASFKAVMKDTVKTTSMTYLILIGANMFGRFLAITQAPMKLASTIESLEVSRYIILLFIVIIYAIMGCFMDALPMITLTIPIFLPIITGLDFDPLWFGVICVLVIELGLVTPPVGLNCYVISGIAKDVPLGTIFRGSAPFIPAILLTILLCTVFPDIATWLPGVLYP